jgi:hypothetical protein
MPSPAVPATRVANKLLHCLGKALTAGELEKVYVMTGHHGWATAIWQNGFALVAFGQVTYSLELPRTSGVPDAFQEVTMSEVERPSRTATSKAERQVRQQQITEAAKEILQHEAESREAKTRRLRTLRVERENREPHEETQVSRTSSLLVQQPRLFEDTSRFSGPQELPRREGEAPTMRKKEPATKAGS